LKKSITLIFTSVVILFCYIFLLNRYPLFWGDSITYLKYAYKNEWHTFGSILYPQLLRLVLYFQSPWVVILLQSLISSYVLLEFTKNYFNKNVGQIYLGLTLILCFSSYGFFVNTMMPDIFLGLGIVCNYSIISKKIKLKSIPIYLIFAFCLMAHNGFIYIFILINIILGILFLVQKNRDSLKSVGLSFTIILCVLFFVRPIVGSLYQYDERDNRNINFFCRQILISSFNGTGSFQDLLSYRCKEGFNSEVCSYTPSKKEISNLKFRKKIEVDCKDIFLTALSNIDFLKKFVGTKISNAYFMSYNFRLLRNSGSNIKWHDKIQIRIPEEKFLPIEQSIVNTNSLAFKNRILILADINWMLIIISVFLIITFYFLKLFQNSLKTRISVLSLERGAFMIFYFILAISISIVFYTLFSRFSNTRYAIRLSWLIILLASTITIDLISKKWVNRDKEI